jgi:hypothetical protein
MRNWCLALALAASAVPAAAVAPQLKFDVPPGWQTKAPASSMRVAEFVLPKADGDAADASLVVYFFGAGSGGSVQANLDRWIGQMTQPDGRATSDVARTETRASRSGIPLTVVDVSGTYVAEVAPGASERFNEPGYRLIAGVVDTAGGAHYVKLTGPAATVAKWEASVAAFLASLRME